MGVAGSYALPLDFPGKTACRKTFSFRMHVRFMVPRSTPELCAYMPMGRYPLVPHAHPNFDSVVFLCADLDRAQPNFSHDFQLEHQVRCRYEALGAGSTSLTVYLPDAQYAACVMSGRQLIECLRMSKTQKSPSGIAKTESNSGRNWRVKGAK